jgi:hypothetical protein
MPRRDAARGSLSGHTYVTGVVPMRIHTAIATTTAAGALTYDISAAGFASILGATATCQRDTTDPTRACFALVRSCTPTQVVVQVFESKTSAVLLLGVNIEGLEPTNLATTVSLIIFGA